jgi:hypothetical protein
MLKRVDTFLKAGLTKAYAEREGRAGRVEAADGVPEESSDLRADL